jgi:cyclohexyl-isocyanide hydratase
MRSATPHTELGFTTRFRSPEKVSDMRIAFIIYEGMTSLEFVGVYDPLTRLKEMGFISDLEWDVCGVAKEVRGSGGLMFTPNKVGQPLVGYDMIIVIGGGGARTVVRDESFIKWLKSAAPCKLKVSVCTGSLLLAAAGFLKGKKATTHRNAMKELRELGVEVVDQRIVDEGEIITARGVTSAIDLGFYLCEKLAGYEAREKIRKQMDYHYHPQDP